MYRINSISKQLVSLQVVSGGKLRAVNLLPGNFVFTEKITSQLKNLQENKVIRIHEITSVSKATKSPVVDKPQKVAGSSIRSLSSDKSSK